MARSRYEDDRIEYEVIQAARWFVSLTGNTEQTSEYLRLQEAVVQYNHRNPYEPLRRHIMACEHLAIDNQGRCENCFVTPTAEYWRGRYKKAMLALESLTPSGSEYVGDPDHCVAHVRYVREQQMSVIKRLVIVNRRFEALMDTIRHSEQSLRNDGYCGVVSEFSKIFNEPTPDEMNTLLQDISNIKESVK